MQLRYALLALLLAPFGVEANRNVSVEIAGTDNVCSSYAVSVSGGAAIYTCVPASTQPGAPAGCAATVNSSSSLTLTSAGGNANFLVSCSTPVSGITWNWSKNSVFGANTNASWTDALGANGSSTVDNVYRYQVRACNGASCSTVPTSPLVVTVPNTGSGGGTACGGFDNTIDLTLVWGSGTQRLFTGHMGANDVVVVAFTAGNVSTTTSLPRINAAEYNSPPSSRIAVLSATRCDFGAQSTTGASSGPSNSTQNVFAVGTGSGFGFYPVVPTNATRYINIRNVPNSTCATGGECQMFIDLTGTAGL